MNHEHMTPKEAAEYLDRSVLSIYKYIEEGKLNVVDDHRWNMKRNRQLYRGEVEKLKESLKKPGLTTTDIAKELNIKSPNLTNYIKKGLLAGEKKKWGKREIFFVEPEEAERFIEWYRNEKQNKKNSIHRVDSSGKSFYSKEHKVYLYQSFVIPEQDVFARITEISEDSIVLTDDAGKKYSWVAARKNGFVPKGVYEPSEHFTTNGYVEIHIPTPTDILDPKLDFLELLYEKLTVSNLYMHIYDSHMRIFMKPFRLEESNIYVVNLIEKFLIDGEIEKRKDGFFINSSIDDIRFPVHKEVKELLIKEAEARGISLGEFVNRIVKEYIKRNDTM